MKKLILFLVVSLAISLGLNAQDNKDKEKKTSTIPQKVHNTFSKHKKYNGYKTKREHHGIKRKHKVKYKDGRVVNKTKPD